MIGFRDWAIILLTLAAAIIFPIRRIVKETNETLVLCQKNTKNIFLKLDKFIKESDFINVITEDCWLLKSYEKASNSIEYDAKELKVVLEKNEILIKNGVIAVVRIKIKDTVIFREDIVVVDSELTNFTHNTTALKRK